MYNFFIEFLNEILNFKFFIFYDINNIIYLDLTIENCINLIKFLINKIYLHS